MAYLSCSNLYSIHYYLVSNFSFYVLFVFQHLHIGSAPFAKSLFRSFPFAHAWLWTDTKKSQDYKSWDENISAVPPGFPVCFHKNRTLSARNVCPRHRLPRVCASPVLLRRENSLHTISERGSQPSAPSLCQQCMQLLCAIIAFFISFGILAQLHQNCKQIFQITVLGT